MAADICFTGLISYACHSLLLKSMEKIVFTSDGSNDIVDHITLNVLQEICFQTQLFSFVFGFVLLIDALTQ